MTAALALLEVEVEARYQAALLAGDLAAAARLAGTLDVIRTVATESGMDLSASAVAAAVTGLPACTPTAAVSGAAGTSSSPCQATSGDATSSPRDPHSAAPPSP